MDEAGLDPSEKSLLERAVHGDVEAFSELVRTHYPAVRVYLGAQVHDHGALDDLAQDVFLRAFRGLPALRHRVAFRAWLACQGLPCLLRCSFTCTRTCPLRSLRRKS